MAARKISSKKRSSETAPEALKTDKLKRSIFGEEDDVDLDLSSDIKGIMSALQHIRSNAQKDGQKKNEETISSVASEVKCKLDELKTKLDKDRQGFIKSLLKSSKEFENLLKGETTKFQNVTENFNREKATHLQTLKDSISKCEQEKERLFQRYEQQKKKERIHISDHEKACLQKIAQLEESLKKKKQNGKTFSTLRKKLGSFIGNASDEEFIGNGSDEDFPHDD
ncbi:uncharacterized protein LOC124911113 [Impatiens glandulifera]|uniref:uncharacterized protein LOC124911113 n=1 Tax=Impatiens glandulifera TaxID=253017 RepID=UPI001FB13944|nr:uncharacterized protein LOC124911113 [Impatiens glandulifera]